MKRHDPEGNDVCDDLGELDRLVTMEFKVLQREFQRGRRKRPRAGEQAVKRDNVVFPKDWPGQRRQVDSDHEIPVADQEWDRDDLSYADLDGFEVQEQRKSAGDHLFAEDELRFIEDAVTWLATRENKDLLIGRIWERLTETETSAFYTPPDEHPDPDLPRETDSPDGDDQPAD